MTAFIPHLFGLVGIVCVTWIIVQHFIGICCGIAGFTVGQWLRRWWRGDFA